MALWHRTAYEVKICRLMVALILREAHSRSEPSKSLADRCRLAIGRVGIGTDARPYGRLAFGRACTHQIPADPEEEHALSGFIALNCPY